MRNRATAERAAPRLGILISIVLHLGLVVALFVSFSKKLDMPSESVVMVPVDLVTVGDENNVKPTVKPDITPPEVQDQQPTPAPDVAPPKFDVAPDAKPEPKKKTDAEKFADVLNDLDKTIAKKKPANAQVAARTVQGVGAGTAMTADLTTALVNQIRRCWSPPVQVKLSSLAVVTYEVHLSPAGRVTSITPANGVADVATSDLDMQHYARKGETQRSTALAPLAAAQLAAKQAIQACQPYRLPANRYREWYDVILKFDPREMAQ